jgi:epoxyqueuosine reductase
MHREQVFELAREAGFDLAGIAPLQPPRDVDRFDAWLAAGRHAGLDYLARNAERIRDPRRTLPKGKSILVVGLAHSRAAVELEGGGRIARYAAGRDYHNVLTKRLRKLRRRLVETGLIAKEHHSRIVADAGPLLERSHAAEAGIGFPSKAANLLHPRFGPWFFLGELLLDLDLEPTPTPPAGSCGTCTACIDACPTQAIVGPGEVDANRCISYHTIESRGPAPHELREQIAAWAYGCDICSEVCPWGREAPDTSERFGTHAEVEHGSLIHWLSRRDDDAWSVAFERSSLRRPGRAGLVRNAAIALASARSTAGELALLNALSFDPSSVVRDAAAWSLLAGYSDGAGVRAAVERAASSESDPLARAAMRRSLGESR